MCEEKDGIVGAEHEKRRVSVEEKEIVYVMAEGGKESAQWVKDIADKGVRK